MHKARLFGVAVAGFTLLATVTPASAELTEEFFTGGEGEAGWVAFDPAPEGATENASIALTLKTSADYAGVELAGFAAEPPETPPSFTFRSSVTNAGSGGSPRLVMLFDDGGKMELRPLSWTADEWVVIDGSVVDATQGWDNGGGSCGFLYNTSYATALACHGGAVVTDVFVVTDSAWLYTAGYTHYIDDIAYGGDTLSFPPTCLADFTGSHENGPVSGPVHDVVEPVAAGAGLGETVHGINCDVIVPLGL